MIQMISGMGRRAEKTKSRDQIFLYRETGFNEVEISLNSDIDE